MFGPWGLYIFIYPTIKHHILFLFSSLLSLYFVSGTISLSLSWVPSLSLSLSLSLKDPLASPYFLCILYHLPLKIVHLAMNLGCYSFMRIHGRLLIFLYCTMLVTLVAFKKANFPWKSPMKLKQVKWTEHFDSTVHIVLFSFIEAFDGKLHLIQNSTIQICYQPGGKSNATPW